MNKYPTGEEKLSVYTGNVPDSFEITFIKQNDWASGELIAFYLGGVGAGLYVISQFIGFSAGLLLGFFLAAICKNVAHMKSASHPKRAFRALLRPQVSWISRGALFVLLFTVFGALDITHKLGWIYWSSFQASIFATLAFSSAVLVMVYLGFLMAGARAIPLWHSPLTPAIFLSYSLTLGAGAVAVLYPLMGNGPMEPLARLLLLTASITLFLLIMQLIVLNYSGRAAMHTVRLLTRETLKGIFMGGVLMGGLILPILVAGYMALWGKAPGIGIFAVGIFLLAGGFLYEKVLLQAGVFSPLLEK